MYKCIIKKKMEINLLYKTTFHLNFYFFIVWTSAPKTSLSFFFCTNRIRNMPGYYTRIADALSNLLIGEKVWAIDVFRALGNGNNYVGKTFVLATPFAMYRKMVFHRHPSVYEVIQSQTPVKLYLDVEFEVTAEEENLAKTECINIIEFFKYIIIKHLQLAFPTQEVKMEGMQIFQACTEKKFSIHIVHNDVVFDNAQVSCMAYVGELEAYLKYVLATEVGELPPNVDAIMAIHRLQCHCGKMIDLSVYKKNQQYRYVISDILRI